MAIAGVLMSVIVGTFGGAVMGAAMFGFAEAAQMAFVSAVFVGWASTAPSIGGAIIISFWTLWRSPPRVWMATTIGAAVGLGVALSILADLGLSLASGPLSGAAAGWAMAKVNTAFRGVEA
ncbi:MAG: hypothetical protein ACPGFC_07820 [Paracoccaceae bacterium]